MTTIFEKIIAKEIPADFVYEDEYVVAFLDIKPVHVGHTLVVPKTPFINIFDGDVDILAHMMKIGVALGKRIQDRLGAPGVNLIMNNGAAAGQEVFHAHLHVVPRYENDQAFMPRKNDVATPEEIAVVAAKLR